MDRKIRFVKAGVGGDILEKEFVATESKSVENLWDIKYYDHNLCQSCPMGIFVNVSAEEMRKKLDNMAIALGWRNWAVDKGATN